MSEYKRILIEEKYIPEEQRLLGSKTTYVLTDGSILKEVKISFCDSCGYILSEGIIGLCSSCQGKTCQTCTIIHENKIYCRDCSKAFLSIEKEQFIILYGVANEISLKKIKKFSFINLGNLKEHLSSLIERGLIERKGVSFFKQYSPTDIGLSVLSTCEQIYQREGDIQLYMKKAQEFLEDKRR